MGFHRNLSDTKSLQVSWTILSVKADLNDDAIWIVPIGHQIPAPFSSLWGPFQARQ